MANTTTSESCMKPATRLRKLLSQPGVCIQAPGVYDGLCARIAIEQGFQVMYQGGSMTTAARLGRADLAFASLNDFAQNAQMIANIDPRIPLIADADVGFGSPPNIARMVQMYDSCGVAGFHIEDQVANKRCGHLKGKEVVDIETWKSRIRACVIGRDSIYGGSDILIIARTDSLAVEGYQAALDRLLAAQECGADMGFLEAIETEEQIKNAVKVLAPMPLMVNLVSNGKTPWFSPEMLGEWGVKLAIYPGAAGKSVLHTIRRAYKYLMETGQDDAEAQGLDPKGFFDVMGLQREMEIDRLAGGVSFTHGA
ncbi:Pyruvate/Phosphoenolpyruvate kinase [Penicillium cf. griseofulvum]|uniref:Pyruvate/Phosphoenolpyruvate kinase n=1 Tax=Penicillium cf. griseofulvum TaxID=2972120 RepID=A0A9W9J606_9EURO|nr:Pyruvate/Phosphoenolpyruvate kinase [Penicillium cf. griseofulvum]KAJ5434652.1 Pyruvate/Phosphoenolpyruvate kinase [Penicillium cf. griseofulvum]KAJ5452481.1 Pyruvate/Phosphoenolpyruvate kinase [Penicillium cf. griseofulvum]